MKDLGADTKATVEDATKSSKMAENALASIDARVEEIANRMEKAKEVQTDYEVIKFAIDTTEKALSDLEVSPFRNTTLYQAFWVGSFSSHSKFQNLENLGKKPNPWEKNPAPGIFSQSVEFLHERSQNSSIF